MRGWHPSRYLLGLEHLLILRRHLLVQDRVQLGARWQLLRKVGLVELRQILLLLLVIMVVSFISTLVGGVILSLLLISVDWMPL